MRMSSTLDQEDISMTVVVMVVNPSSYDDVEEEYMKSIEYIIRNDNERYQQVDTDDEEEDDDDRHDHDDDDGPKQSPKKNILD